jgi:hypothetical protein
VEGIAAWSASDVWTVGEGPGNQGMEVGTLSGSSWTGQTLPSPQGQN